MGQGDLMRFEPTPGFNPFRKVSNRTNNRRSTDAEDTKKGNTLGPAATCRRARVSSKGSVLLYDLFETKNNILGQELLMIDT